MKDKYKYLTDEQYQRLCECRSRKEDIPALARCYMKDENTAPEDALVSALELLDSNNQCIDLTQEEYDAVIAEIKAISVLTDIQLKELKDITENTHTDSDIIDFCNKHELPYKDAGLIVKMWNAPSFCKTCKNFSCYDTLYPCTDCSRIKTDHYEPN